VAATGLNVPSAALAQDATAIKDETFYSCVEPRVLETEFYLRATTGKGIEAADAGSDAGQVKGGRKVAFKNKAIGEFAQELAENELAHVRFYRKALGSSAVARPTVDFEGGFAAIAKAVGCPTLIRLRTI
jgi:hypothetical protein